MISFMKKVKFNLPLSNQKYLITTSKNVDQINIIKQQNKKVLETKINQQKKLKKAIRTLTTFNQSVPIAPLETAIKKNGSAEFLAVFSDLVRDLTELTEKYDSKETSKWFAKVLQYNVPTGKQTRGLVIVSIYKSLVAKYELTPENLRLIQVLGWCVEMIQSACIIIDDIMDNSITRRGQPCWYTVDNVGLTAINNAFMIKNSVFYILKKYFNQKPCYVALLEQFHEIIFITSFGQLLDMETANKNVTEFTMDRFKTISANKTSNFAFIMPFTLAMYMAGWSDQEAFRQAKTILLEMGEFYQIQDDFFDCFGDPTVTGKIGTDIRDNKCSWLAVVCMQRANEEQKSIMMECYGKSDPDKIHRIKELYMELGLPDIYYQYEQDFYKMIKTLIEQTSSGVPHEIFYKLLDKIYQKAKMSKLL